jgi:hypothetical protein
MCEELNPAHSHPYARKQAFIVIRSYHNFHVNALVISMSTEFAPGTNVVYVGDEVVRGPKHLDEGTPGKVVAAIPGTSNVRVDFGACGLWNVLMLDLETV